MLRSLNSKYHVFNIKTWNLWSSVVWGHWLGTKETGGPCGIRWEPDLKHTHRLPSGSYFLQGWHVHSVVPALELGTWWAAELSPRAAWETTLPGPETAQDPTNPPFTEATEVWEQQLASGCSRADSLCTAHACLVGRLFFYLTLQMRRWGLSCLPRYHGQSCRHLAFLIAHGAARSLCFESLTLSFPWPCSLGSAGLIWLSPGQLKVSFLVSRRLWPPGHAAGFFVKVQARLCAAHTSPVCHPLKYRAGRGRLGGRHADGVGVGEGVDGKSLGAKVVRKWCLWSRTVQGCPRKLLSWERWVTLPGLWEQQAQVDIYPGHCGARHWFPAWVPPSVEGVHANLL